MKAKVAILGGGLSAAYAWRCCLDNDIVPDVYADRVFVPPGGCIWAHWLPRSLRCQKLYEPIKIVSVGDAGGYAVKLWWRSDIKTSFPDKPVLTKGVNPLKAARALWGKEHHGTVKVGKKLEWQDIHDLQKLYDLIIQTFPPIGREPEYVTPIWVIPAKGEKHNLVRYEGDHSEAYARFSQLFEIRSYEFTPTKKIANYELMARHWGNRLGFDSQKGAQLWFAPEIPPEEVGGMIIENYVDRNVLYCGRWASKDRKFLSHETYKRALETMKVRGLLEKDGDETLGLETAGYDEPSRDDMAAAEGIQRTTGKVMHREVESWKVG